LLIAIVTFGPIVESLPFVISITEAVPEEMSPGVNAFCLPLNVSQSEDFK
jgi:hypothetical protein